MKIKTSRKRAKYRGRKIVRKNPVFVGKKSRVLKSEADKQLKQIRDYIQGEADEQNHVG